jgi:hypothetical protein
VHGANEFHAQFQLLQIDLITDLLLLCINFLSQSQNCGCVYWIEPIHAASDVSLLAHYMVVGTGFCCKLFHGAIKHFYHGMTQRSATVLALQILHCGM